MCFLALGGLVLVVFLSWGASSAARSLDRVTAAIKRNPEAGKAAVEKVAQRLTAVNGGLERFADWLTEVGNRKL